MMRNGFQIALVMMLGTWSLVVPLRAESGKTDESQPKPLRTFIGEVTSIGKIDKTITIRKFPLTRTFLVAVTCRIATTGKPDATLQDLQRGDKVKVKYEQEKDGFIARSITLRGIDEEDREEARQKEQLEPR